MGILTLFDFQLHVCVRLFLDFPAGVEPVKLHLLSRNLGVAVDGGRRAVGDAEEDQRAGDPRGTGRNCQPPALAQRKGELPQLGELALEVLSEKRGKGEKGGDPQGVLSSEGPTQEDC